ncbi:MAG: alkaline phosphatase family protein [Anaerolineales bacterium]|nr:alkaline phosphatase family protein [Anaerolineales bacterium]
MHPEFVKPTYGPGGFAGLPGILTSLFEGGHPLEPFAGGYDTVILGFIDGFGWRHFEKFAAHPVLDRFIRHGLAAKWTSQFPSTTSGHVTCIHTGLNVGQSGVFEWNYYEPLLDAMIVPLLFSFSGTAERDQLKATGIDPQKLYPTGTLYQKLQAQGVHSTVFQHREYTPSTYSNIVFEGATARGFKSPAEMFVNLSLALQEARGRNYFFFYYDKIDSVSHDYGPASRQVEAEIELFLYALERFFFSVPLAKGRTLLLLTADHGQSEVDPATTIYLNRVFPQIGQFLKTNRRGEYLVPGGSCRDMFLYVHENRLDEARELLSKGLEGKAEVVKTEDLMSAGYFGPDVSERLRARVGNLVILPYRYESVWWYEKDKFEQKYYGHHGGLTPQEMEIPLLAVEL